MPYQIISLDENQLLALMTAVLLTSEGKELPDARSGAIADALEYARAILKEANHKP
jgi:hypothetical protein